MYPKALSKTLYTKGAGIVPALFLFLTPAFGQSWNAGGSAIPGYQDDVCAGGTAVIPTANLAAVATYTGAFRTFRWGSRISCALLVSGPGMLVVETIEPTVTAPGQRLFTVTVNGNPQPAIDTFAICGANAPCRFYYHVNGPVLVELSAVIRNALVTGLRWIPDPVVMVACTQSPGCAGLYYFDVAGPNGVHAIAVGAPPLPADGVDLSKWTPIAQ